MTDCFSLLHSSLIGIGGVVALTATGVPILAFVCLLAARTRLLNAHLARQLFVLSCVLCGAVAVAGIFCLAHMPRLAEGENGRGLPFPVLENYAWWHTPQRNTVLLLAALCLLALLLALFIARTWKTLRSSPFILWPASAILALCMPALWSVALVRQLLAFCPATDNSLFAAYSLFAACGLGVFGIGLSAVTGLLWLLLRRSRDDFGRDYYAFAARRCARIGIWCALLNILIIMTLLIYFFPVMSSTSLSLCTLTPDLFRDAVTEVFIRNPERIWLLPALLLLPAFSALALLSVMRDTVPMRRKLSMISGWFFAVLTVVLLPRFFSGLF